jgi:hypothetical protein
MLGFHIPKDILPGAIYSKVLWIRRNNVEIFRSEIADEWTTTIPGTNTNLNSLYYNRSFDAIYDIHGQRMGNVEGGASGKRELRDNKLRNGIYIINGKKVGVR